MRKSAWFWGCCLVAVVVDLGIAQVARSEDQSPEIRLADGHYQPSELEIPADTPITLRVTNGSDAAIEFESFELHRERVVHPGETITVRIGALSAGNYEFFDDFHNDVPHGTIVVK